MSAARDGDLIDAAARGWRAWVVLAFLAIAAALPGFFSIPPLDRDESRFAQATAQMLETGDFAHIRLQDEPRNKKPIGIYWLQAASVAAFSDVEKREIWAWRLPSMLGAVIAAWATFWAGMVLVGRRAAFVGAALLACCVLLSTEAMIAKTDAMLCAMTTLAMAALGRVLMGAGGWRTALVFWAALALGVLTKGPITPMVVGLSALALCAWRRDVMWLRPIVTISGPVLGAMLLAPWLYTMTLSDGSVAGIMRDIAPKLGGGGEHGARPPGLHLLLLPFLIFPASIGLAPAFADGWRVLRAPRDDAAFAGARFLVAWIVPTWLVFELATTKLAHYTLPVYPAIALLAGAGLLRWLDAPSARRRIILALSLFAGSLGIIAAAVVLTQWGARNASVSFGAALTAFSLVISLVIARAPKPVPAMAPALLAALALLVTVREGLAPRATHALVTRAVMQTLPRHDGALLVVGYREPSIVFENGTDTLLQQGEEAALIAAEGQTALVEARERVTFEEVLRERGLVFQPTAPPTLGRNYSNGDDVILQPGRVTPLNADRN